MWDVAELWEVRLLLVVVVGIMIGYFDYSKFKNGEACAIPEVWGFFKRRGRK
jgi:hypothetical protein